MMTLGIIGDFSEDGFRRVHELGLGAIEFCHNVGNAPEALAVRVPDIARWSGDTGVRVGAIGRWGTVKLAPDGSIVEEELRASYAMIDVCADVGCPVFNTGVNLCTSLPFLKNCDAAVKFLSMLVSYAERKGVKVATYNCGWQNFINRPVVWQIVHGRIPSLGIKYDPSHCVNSGSGDYLGEAVAWGDRFYHFHIKGTLNVGGVHIDDPPAGLDCINWRALLGILYKHGYAGMLSIEPHSGVWQGDLGDWGVKLTIDYIKPLIFTGV